MTEGNKPVENYRSGAIKVAVWENSGENGKYYTFSMQRGYKDKDGNWKDTTALRTSDVYDVVRCLERAYDFAKQKKEE